MAVTFRGIGVVYIPGSNRFVRFVGGEYATSDDAEIAVLSLKYDYDKIELVEPPIEDKPKRGRPRNAEN